MTLMASVSGTSDDLLRPVVDDGSKRVTPQLLYPPGKRETAYSIVTEVVGTGSPSILKLKIPDKSDHLKMAVRTPQNFKTGF
ncbi:hypothetical protein AVEN_270911-1 [Araneus ventricosus]|uniref:Uncharacterized protein n=1 Tax=Araneus ventricosus TaxID=182803 RepID=A0A4Y2TCU0_ARAVE|nr:hypothetical protein AVEN_270911-1 [Araneus ventricosus]